MADEAAGYKVVAKLYNARFLRLKTEHSGETIV